MQVVVSMSLQTLVEDRYAKFRALGVFAGDSSGVAGDFLNA